MKKFILSLAALVVTGLGLTSCNNDFENTKVSYPAQMPYGYYQSQYTPDDNHEYAITYTTNSAGQPLLVVKMRGKSTASDSGVYRNIIATTDVKYDPATGILSATSEGSLYDFPVLAFAAFQKDNNKVTLNVIKASDSTRQVVSTLVKSQPSDIYGTWTANINGVQTTLVLNDKGQSTSTPDGGAKTVITHQFANGAGVITFADGTQGSVSYNANGQLVMTVNGQQVILDPAQSKAEPEIMIPIYEGEYTSGLFNSLGTCTLYQSNKDESKYQIKPFVQNRDGIYFTYNKSTGLIVIKDQDTMYDFVQDGQPYGHIMISDAVTKGANGAVPSSYDATTKTFTFNVVYFVKAGSFPAKTDVFVLQNEIPRDEAPAMIRKTPKFELKNVQLFKNK
ncbi:hypothetical protein [Alloprevotella tannerae]|jgi:hypothetical protein|uniref:hypothetical protein n=1 Tax=Alloprevotella tannerae TaxID=76122 RepID=UPI0028EAE33D|nr:hypothetical protein [Alloprevotella tannerae]